MAAISSGMIGLRVAIFPEPGVDTLTLPVEVEVEEGEPLSPRPVEFCFVDLSQEYECPKCKRFFYGEAALQNVERHFCDFRLAASQIQLELSPASERPAPLTIEMTPRCIDSNGQEPDILEEGREQKFLQRVFRCFPILGKLLVRFFPRWCAKPED